MNEDNTTSAPADPVAPEAAPEAPVAPEADSAAAVAPDAPAVAPEGAPAPEEAVQKEGDTCTTEDGRPGTLSALQDGSFQCVPTPQHGDPCTTTDGREGTVDADGACLVNE